MPSAVSSEPRYDVCVVGAGLIGLATARALAGKFAGASILVLDKEDQIAAHQSSHNSGVIHSGLYYEPGSLKARLCVEGRNAVYDICEAEEIAVKRSGKLVIATEPNEIPALEELERRGRANGLAGLERLGPDGIKDHEPEAVGIDALYVPEAGVADFPALAAHISEQLRAGGADVRLGHAVTAIEHTVGGITITAGDQRFAARTLVNCAGLHSDRIAALAGVQSSVQIIPFRGEYYRLSDEAEGLVKTLIYPVPDPRFPFLGVHFTRRIDGRVEVGPNAVLALGREQYRGVGPDWSDLREVLGSRGFRRLAMKHWLSGTKELLSSRSRRLYARLARRLVPATRPDHLIEGGAGVRAQAVRSDGSLVDDFVIEQAGSSIHVLNAPSPGATASLAIGWYISEQVEPLLAR